MITTPIQGIKETFIDRTQNVHCGEGECFTLWTNDPKQLFHSLKKEYGPICSKMYIDRLQVNGQMASEHIGYVFTGWTRYEDTHEPYQREVWIEFIPEDDERI